MADRLYAAVNKDAVQSCAHSETLLLQAYNVSPPPRYTGSEPPGIRDSVATGVLQLYHPCLLLSSEHTSVCRRRRILSFPGIVAQFVCRSEDHHIHLRLLTTLEIAAHMEWYDIAYPYKGLLKDHRIVRDTPRIAMVCFQAWTVLGDYDPAGKIQRAKTG